MSSSPLDSVNEEPLEVGELTPSRRLKRPVTKEQAAHLIADKIVRVFAWVIVGTVVLDFLLLSGIIWVYKDAPDHIEAIVTKGIVPLLTATATLTSTIFGPLLAFILGYYFNQKHKQDETNNVDV